MNAISFTFKDRSSLTAPLALAIVKSVQTMAGFTLTVSGLSGANTIRAARDIVAKPEDPEALRKLLAALELSCDPNSTEAARIRVTPIVRDVRV